VTLKSNAEDKFPSWDVKVYLTLPYKSPLQKNSAALMFSGIFLGLVGTLGWQEYNSNTTFDGTPLLGPVLSSVGGTFMLTSVCKFVVGCVAQNQDVTESAMHLFTLNHQIMLHNAVVCIPPSYNFMQLKLGHTSVVSHDAPVTPSDPSMYNDITRPQRVRVHDSVSTAACPVFTPLIKLEFLKTLTCPCALRQCAAPPPLSHSKLKRILCSSLYM
uniref:Uncharacterized protein n=1 Tax=Periophthalmus magnuspinnatus TaxID=409849 RepID=A0A3B4AWQ7_9GOBI